MTDPRLPSMSRTESLVMELLRGRERYGLELVDASGGSLKRGSVYVILARMEEKGFVDSRQEVRRTAPAGCLAASIARHRYGAKVHEAFSLLRDALALKTRGGAMSFECPDHWRLPSAFSPIARSSSSSRRRSRICSSSTAQRREANGEPPCGAQGRRWRSSRRPRARLRRLVAADALPACYYIFLLVISSILLDLDLDRLLRRGHADSGVVVRSRDGLLLARAADRAPVD